MNAPATTELPVVVIGAGPAGLAAAPLLGQGIEPLVLEAGQSAGAAGAPDQEVRGSVMQWGVSRRRRAKGYCRCAVFRQMRHRVLPLASAARIGLARGWWTSTPWAALPCWPLSIALQDS